MQKYLLAKYDLLKDVLPPDREAYCGATGNGQRSAAGANVCAGLHVARVARRPHEHQQREVSRRRHARGAGVRRQDLVAPRHRRRRPGRQSRLCFGTTPAACVRRSAWTSRRLATSVATACSSSEKLAVRSIVDTNGDDKADKEIEVAGGWKESFHAGRRLGRRLRSHATAASTSVGARTTSPIRSSRIKTASLNTV